MNLILDIPFTYLLFKEFSFDCIVYLKFTEIAHTHKGQLHDGHVKWFHYSNYFPLYIYIKATCYTP